MRGFVRIAICAIIFIVANVGYYYYQHSVTDNDLDQCVEVELTEFISLDSLKVLEPRLHNWILQKNPKFDYDGYGILDKGGFTFLFGLSALEPIVYNVTVFKGDSLVQEICPLATINGVHESLHSTGPIYVAECEPMDISSKDGVSLVNMEDLIYFEDFNEDGLLDFILQYDRGGSMGVNRLLVYQKADGSGFEEKLNDRSIYYSDEMNLICSHISAGRYGGYTYGLDPKSLKFVYSANWECLNSKNLTFNVERFDLNKKFTHEMLLADPEILPWDDIDIVMDSLKYLIMN